jgi:hypothetical protein
MNRVLRWAATVAALSVVAGACANPGDDLDVAAMLREPASTTTVPGQALATTEEAAAAAGAAAGGQAPGSPRAGSAGRTTAAASLPGAHRPAGGPVTGRGFDKDKIVIGVELVAPLAGGAAKIGGKGADTGDTRAQAQAVIDYVNKRGGIAGRQVVPVYRETNQEANWDAEAQANCAHFTEDNQTFLVVSALLSISPNLASCLAGRGTPFVLQGRTMLDDTDLRALSPYVYIPGRMSPTRWGAVTVDGLAAQGWFRPGMTLGLVSFDKPQHIRTANDVVIPRLAQRGVQVKERIVVKHPGSVSGFGDSSAQISNGILRMRNAGVDHVMILDDHGMLTFLFMPQAEAQGWRPAYGLNSLNQGTTMMQNAPDGQLPGVTMVGWVPGDDVLDEQDPPGNPTRDLCLGIMKAARIEYPARVAVASALGYCDAFLFLQAALSRAPALTVAGLRAGVDALGESHVSPLGFGTRFGPGRYDGGAGYRALAYDTACQCFSYKGPVASAP